MLDSASVRVSENARAWQGSTQRSKGEALRKFSWSIMNAASGGSDTLKERRTWQGSKGEALKKLIWSILNTASGGDETLEEQRCNGCNGNGCDQMLPTGNVSWKFFSGKPS